MTMRIRNTTLERVPIVSQVITTPPLAVLLFYDGGGNESADSTLPCLKYRLPQRPIIVPLLVCIALMCGACATSFKYNAKSTSPFDIGPNPPAIMLADVMPGGGLHPSAGGEFYDVDSEKVYRELNRSVREHCIASGLVAERGPFAPAPATEEELRRVLDEAVMNEARAVLLIRPVHMGASGNIPLGIAITDLVFTALIPFGGVGILPVATVYSLPVLTERASARVEGVLVDPETGSVLWTSAATVQRQRKSTSWGYDPPRQIAPAFREALQQLLQEASLSIRNGFAEHPTDMDATSLLFPVES
jgi:hypothetical protein